MPGHQLPSTESSYSASAEPPRVGLQPQVGTGYSVIFKVTEQEGEGTRPPATTMRRGGWGPQGSLEACPCSPLV